MFPLIYARTNDWVNNRDAGNLKRHRAYYDVMVSVVLYVKDTTEGAKDTYYYTSMSSAPRNENKWATHSL